jgi:hypothetical protein
MRPKIVGLVIGIAFIAIVVLSLLRGRQNPPSDSPADTASAAGRKSAAARIAGAPEQRPGTNGTSSVAAQRSDVAAGVQPAGLANSKSGSIAKSSSSGQSQSREEYIEQRVGELMDLGMTDDPEALKTLLSEINNPEGEIRKAAIEALKQFGSADAIPKLEEALSSADTADKQEIREAIEFLKLPSFLAKRN